MENLFVRLITIKKLVEMMNDLKEIDPEGAAVVGSCATVLTADTKEIVDVLEFIVKTIIGKTIEETKTEEDEIFLLNLKHDQLETLKTIKENLE